ncbi:Cysteine protease atg4b [Haplosporangium sp. Z 27]|nr:Cysteine protease atg4b [Haplosporangium sp. Z 27]
MLTPVRSSLDEDLGVEEDQELVLENISVEEPDTGEHFMQATSEFFSKMGYWLYNSRVVQYIARDDRVRVKTIFQTEEIWILGVCYTFESYELTCSLPESSRSRKISSLQHQGRIGDSKNTTIGQLGLGYENIRDSKRGWERRTAHPSTSPRTMADNDSISTFASTMVEGSELGFNRSKNKEQHLERLREKEMAKSKKLAQIRERELEREEKAREKARLKEQEKIQKLKSKISHPHFDSSNLRDGTKDISEVTVGNTKDQSHLYPDVESTRKSRSIHGYNHEEDSSVGLGLTTPSGEPKQSVIRRMRSISILQKVPNALDSLAQKKSMQELQPRVLHDRTNQPRSQSVSNISVVSQRSTATSSITSHDSSSKRRPTSPSPPSSMKTTMSVHETLVASPKPTALSKFTHLNLDQKKLPELPPPDLDDMSDIPIYLNDDSIPNDYDELVVHGQVYESVHIPPVPDNEMLDPTSALSKDSKPGKRRMTISGIFSKEPKPSSSSSSGLAVLKTLVNASKISLRPKAEDPTPIPRVQSPLSIGSTNANLSFGPQLTGKDGAPSLKKGGVTKNVQHWIERRISSNNLHQAFVANTDEPVPPISKDLTLSPPNSPVATRMDPRILSQAPERQKENDPSYQPRIHKKSSTLLTTSTASTVSVHQHTLKPGSPQNTSSISTFSNAHSTAESLAIQRERANSSHIKFAPALQHAASLLEDKIYKKSALISGLSLHVESGPYSEPIPAHEQSYHRDTAVHSPPSPESPSEAFILLNQRNNTSTMSFERDLEGSVLVSMPDHDETSLSVALNNCNQEISVDEDPIRVENKRLFDKLAAFSNDKSESISDLRSEWESLWPSKPEANQDAEKGATDFVHIQKIQKSKSQVLKEENMTLHDRERIRKIGSAYVKIRNPALEIVAPQPKFPALLQSQTMQSSHIEDIPRPSSAERFGDSLQEKVLPNLDGQSRPRLIPVQTVPSQPPPSSPKFSSSKSWRTISPRPHSPVHALSFISSSKSTSSRSASVQASSPLSDKEGHLPVVEHALVDNDDTPKNGVTLPPQPLALHPLDKPVLSPSLLPNQRVLIRFMSDFQSKFWFTYRKDIPRIDPSYYTSDAGWGCMMRTGQSLLAQAFANVLLGRDWRIKSSMTEEKILKYRAILSWFADEPERPYSIHNIAKSGMYLDKRVGEWFGPSTVAHALKRLSEQHINCPLSVIVPMDNTVRFSDILRVTGGRQYGAGLNGTGHQTNNWKPVILLMPARFGLDKLTERYVGNLKRLFRLPQFLGIAGGRPGRSLYFIANQGNELFYLDPHFVKPRATQEELSSIPSTSFHCGIVRTMDIMEMDPSMMLGFLIQSEKDLLNFSTRLKNEMERGYPLLTVIEDVNLDLQSQEATNQNTFTAEMHVDAATYKALNADSTGKIRKTQADTHVILDLVDENQKQGHIPSRSKREMKRVTKTIVSSVPGLKSLDNVLTPRTTTDIFQDQDMVYHQDHDDNLSVHSYNSDDSIV